MFVWNNIILAIKIAIKILNIRSKYLNHQALFLYGERK